MPESKAPRAAGLLVTACDDPRCGCGTMMLHLTDEEGQALAEFRLERPESRALGQALLKEVCDQLSYRRFGLSREIH